MRPSSAQSCVAASVPNASFSSVAIAPIMRAVPEMRCWLESSRTAVVSVMPGISTIRLAMITGRTVIGAT